MATIQTQLSLSDQDIANPVVSFDQLLVHEVASVQETLVELPKDGSDVTVGLGSLAPVKHLIMFADVLVEATINGEPWVGRTLLMSDMNLHTLVLKSLGDVLYEGEITEVTTGTDTVITDEDSNFTYAALVGTSRPLSLDPTDTDFILEVNGRTALIELGDENDDGDKLSTVQGDDLATHIQDVIDDSRIGSAQVTVTWQEDEDDTTKGNLLFTNQIAGDYPIYIRQYQSDYASLANLGLSEPTALEGGVSLADETLVLDPGATDESEHTISSNQAHTITVPLISPAPEDDTPYQVRKDAKGMATLVLAS